MPRENATTRKTLAVHCKGLSISDLLNLPIVDALPVFENVPAIQQKLQTLVDVGLGYLQLGQSAHHAFGRRSAAHQLAKELSKRQTGRTIIFWNERPPGCTLTS